MDAEITALLVDDQPLPCVMLHNAANLAWLDPTARQNRPLMEGSQLELPLWLIKMAKLVENGNVGIEMPRHYNEAFRKALISDASHLDLRSSCEYYFDVGYQLHQLLNDEDLAQKLLKAYVSRFHTLLDVALTTTGRTDMSEKTCKLTHHERQLFNAGLASAREYQRWRSEKPKIEQSKLIRNNKRGRR